MNSNEKYIFCYFKKRGRPLSTWNRSSSLICKKVCLLYNQYKGYEERKQDEKSFTMSGLLITAESSTAVVGLDAVNAIQEDSAKS